MRLRTMLRTEKTKIRSHRPGKVYEGSIGPAVNEFEACAVAIERHHDQLFARRSKNARRILEFLMPVLKGILSKRNILSPWLPGGPWKAAPVD